MGLPMSAEVTVYRSYAVGLSASHPDGKTGEIATSRQPPRTCPIDSYSTDQQAATTGKPLGWRTTSPRPQRLQEDKHDASLGATAGFTPFVPALDRIGPAPDGRSARTARTAAVAARGRGAR